MGKFATDAEYAARSLSEALFNRAYSVYIMSTMYGAIYVPQGYTTELPSNYNYMRQSVPGIYSMLIGDLRYAYDHLPDVSEQNLSADFGRATKGAAAHFLAKLYLQRAQAEKFGTAEYGVDVMVMLILAIRSHILVCYIKVRELLIWIHVFIMLLQLLIMVIMNWSQILASCSVIL